MREWERLNKPAWEGKGMHGFGSSRWQGVTQKLTDKTKCGGVIWSAMKTEAMKSDFKDTNDYFSMDDTAKDVLDALILA